MKRLLIGVLSMAYGIYPTSIQPHKTKKSAIDQLNKLKQKVSGGKIKPEKSSGIRVNISKVNMKLKSALTEHAQKVQEKINGIAGQKDLSDAQKDAQIKQVHEISKVNKKEALQSVLKSVMPQKKEII